MISGFGWVMVQFEQLLYVKYEVITILKNYSLSDWGAFCFHDLVKVSLSLFYPYSSDERSRTSLAIIASAVAY